MEHKIIDVSAVDSKKLYGDYLVKNLFDKLKTKGSPSFLSDWTAVELIGEGVYGKVFKAVHGEGEAMQVSAIKIIEAVDQEPLKGLYSEIQTLSALNNCPNIVHIDDYSSITLKEPNEPAKYYLAIRMEYLTPINAENFPKSEILKLADDICRALVYCHGQEKPIVHCDIKPDNILVDENGNYRLADFGETKQLRNSGTSSSIAKGTPKFMSPGALANEEHNDPRSDLYSLGCTIYALYNGGNVPFWKEFLNSPEYKQQGEGAWVPFREKYRNQLVPRVKEIKPGIMTLIRRMCHYNADERFSSAGEVQRLLNAPPKKQKEARSHLHAWRRFTRHMTAVAAVWIIAAIAAGLTFSAVLVTRSVFVQEAVISLFGAGDEVDNTGDQTDSEEEADSSMESMLDRIGENAQEETDAESAYWSGSYFGGFSVSEIMGFLDSIDFMNSSDVFHFTMVTSSGTIDMEGTRDDFMKAVQESGGSIRSITVTGSTQNSYDYNNDNFGNSSWDSNIFDDSNFSDSEPNYSEPENNNSENNGSFNNPPPADPEPAPESYDTVIE